MRATPTSHPDLKSLVLVQGKFQGLSSRLVQNFNIMEPMDILNSDLNEYGHPEISVCKDLDVLVERITDHRVVG